jgi:hypothetical protein
MLSPLIGAQGARSQLPICPASGSNWLVGEPPRKEFYRQKYVRRFTSVRTSNKKVRGRLKKERPKKLDPHIFTEVVSAAMGIKGQVQRTATDIDMAIKIGRAYHQSREMLKYAGNDTNSIGENLLCRIEDVLALVISLSNTRNFAGVLAALHLYTRTHFQKSVSMKLMGMIHEIFGSAKHYGESISAKGMYEFLDQQDGVEEDDFEVKMSGLKQYFLAWKRHKNSDLAKNLANVINILVTFGICPDWEENPLTLGKFQLFKARAWDVQKHSGSFIEMILDTFFFFIERGHAALINDDMSMLLYSDNDAVKYENEYSLLLSALPLLESGKLADLKSEEIGDDHEYEVRLEKLIATTFEKLKVETSPHMRNTLSNKLVMLKKLRTALIMNQKSSCVRDKPFGVMIYGGSAVGKSCINAALIKVLLSHNGFASSKEHVVTLNDADKFQSEYRAHHTAVTMDDFGNTRAEHYSESPTNKIIDFLNNVPKAALNPNVELKGNIMIIPKLVTVTTNIKDLMAHSFSNEPVSILRRFDFILDVRLRPEYVDSETGGLNGEKVNCFIPDAWLIDVQKVKILRTNGTGADSYEFVTILKDASFFQTLEFLKEASAQHYELQRKFVAGVEELYNTELCEHSYAPTECPYCLGHLQCQGGVESVPQVEEDECIGMPPLLPVTPETEDDDDEDETRDDEETSDDSWEPILREGSLESDVRNWYKERKASCLQHISDACSTITEAFEKHKKEILIGTCAILGIAATVFTAYKAYKCIMNAEHVLDQSCEEKAPVRLDTDTENPWKAVKPVEIPKSENSKTTVYTDLVKKLRKRIGHCYLTDEKAGIRKKCDIVPLKGNTWLLPSHMLEDKTYKIEVQTTPNDILGLNFSQIVDPSCWIRLENDFALIRLVNGGPVPDFSKFLLLDDFKLTAKLAATFIYKDPTGSVEEDIVYITNKSKFTSKAATFNGVSYNYPRPTFPGQCMGVLVPCQKRACILGFHLAGKTGETFGAAGILTLKDFNEGYEKLNAVAPLTCHSTGNFVTQKYGIDFTPVDKVKPYHCVNYLAEDKEGQQPLAEVLGSHPLPTMSFKSQVRQSPISEHVEEVMQLPRIHGPPNPRNIKKHWHRDLDLMTHPKGNFKPKIMEKARDDMITKINKFLDENPEQLELVHPYPKDYVLSGVDGVASVDRVELNSSMGFPINKKKKNFIGPVDRVVPGVTEPIDFEDPQFWAEVERMEQVLASGERVYAIHRGNLKDEPTKFTKDKIRVFAGCEFAFTCLVRKYYLPIIRLIQNNWKEFECAVGINAHGRQWSELKTHLTRFGGKRMIAGDYKAFDKAATPMAMLSAFEILIEIAIRAGYTDEQIEIMRGCATEICYPLYEMDGILIQIFGSNPSGHPLTVIINNLENSLYLRYAYYAMHEGEEVPLFDQRVALACYGDDNAMDVIPEEDKFNHTSVAEELAKVGITYTMADKEAESIPYIPLEDVSFLKRGFIWSDDLKAWLAPLEEASISKSLHNYMHKKGNDVLPAEIAANAIHTANGEYFYHGREVFEIRRAQLLEVARRAGIMGYVGTLPTYTDLMDRFNDSRVKRDAIDEPNAFILDIQSRAIDLSLVSQQPLRIGYRTWSAESRDGFL